MYKSTALDKKEFGHSFDNINNKARFPSPKRRRVKKAKGNHSFSTDESLLELEVINVTDFYNLNEEYEQR